MKKYYLIAGLVLLAASPAFAQVKIGAAGAPDGSAMLEVTGGASNNKGLLMPRMTTVQRNAITSPATGLMIYNTTTNEAQVNTGTPASPTWTAATAAAGWNTNGNTGTTPAANFVGTTDNQPLSLRTNNTEKVRVTAAGNVGIGTTNPGAKLQVSDTGDVSIRVGTTTTGSSSVNLGTGNNFHGITRNLNSSGGGANDVALYTATGPSSPGSIYLVANPTATDSLNLTQFVLKNTGRVGIGTNNPATKLHVDTGSLRVSNGTTALSNPAIQVINDGGGNANNDNIVIQSYGASTQPSLGTFVSRGTFATPANNQAGDNMGNFYTGARVNGVQTTINQIGHIYLGNGTNNKSRMTFSTSNSLAMTIDSNSYVGIGTVSPIVKLQVVDSGDVDIRVGSLTSDRARVSLGNHLHGIVRNLTISGGLANDVALFTNSGAGATAAGNIYLSARSSVNDTLLLNQFTLKNTGNVGIGIKDPATKLHVNSGAFRVSNGSVALASPAIQVINDGGGNSDNDNIVIQSYGASTAPSIGAFTARGTLATPANSQAGDDMGNFYSGARVNGAQATMNRIGNIYMGNGTNNKSRMVFTTSNTTAMTIDSNQNVGIGVIPKVKLQVQGGLLLRNDRNIAHGNGAFITWSTVRAGVGETEFVNYRGTGSGGFRFYDVDPGLSVDTAVYNTNDIAFIDVSGAYHNLSDMRVKTNVNAVNDGLEKVMAMRPVSYDFHTGRTLKDGVVTFTAKDKAVKSIGFLAQELAKVVPEAVTVPKDADKDRKSVV